MGFFKPYWMKEHKNTDGLAKKLDGESPEMLRQIILEAPYDSTVTAALERISDQDFLKGIVLNRGRSWTVRRKALKKLTDSRLLLDCVFDAGNDSIRNDADDLIAEKIPGKDCADYMVRRLRESGNSFSFPGKYVEYLTDPADFEKIIRYDTDEDTREAAWNAAGGKHLENDPALMLLAARMAAEEESAKVRWGAVQFTEDQEVLAYAALHDPEWPIRETAVRKLADQKVLAEVAANDTDPKIRELAREKVGKESLLRKAQKQHVHRCTYLTLYEKNGKGNMERLTDFRKCTVCGQYFCCSDLYKDEPFRDYPWECSHIDTFPFGERVCFTCEETGDKMFGYLLSGNPKPLF